MGTYNVEETLYLAGALYEGMQAKQVLRKQPDPQLSPQDQEKRVKDAAKRKRDFIHKKPYGRFARPADARFNWALLQSKDLSS